MYSGLEMLVKAISIEKQTIQIIVSTKKASSPSLLTDNILTSSPNKAYIVTMAIIMENGTLSTIF